MIIALILSLSNKRQKEHYVSMFYRGFPVRQIIGHIVNNETLTFTQKLELATIINEKYKLKIELPQDTFKKYAKKPLEERDSFYIHYLVNSRIMSDDAPPINRYIQCGFGEHVFDKGVEAPYEDSYEWTQDIIYYGLTPYLTVAGLRIPYRYLRYLGIPYVFPRKH